MRLGEEELGRFRGKVAMVDGGFDPLHVGHLTYFEEAAKLGLPVLCNVRGDDYLRETKKRPPLLPEDQRVRLIDALKPIAYVHLCRTSTLDTLRALRPAKYVKGGDWKARGLPAEETAACRELGIEIVYLDTVLDSSTKIYQRYTQGVKQHGVR